MSYGNLSRMLSAGAHVTHIITSFDWTSCTIGWTLGKRQPWLSTFLPSTHGHDFIEVASFLGIYLQLSCISTLYDIDYYIPDSDAGIVRYPMKVKSCTLSRTGTGMKREATCNSRPVIFVNPDLTL